MIRRWIASWQVWRATRRYAAKDLEGARDWVARAVNTDPDLPLAPQYLGVIALKLGRQGDADEHLRKAAGRGSDPFVVSQALGALDILKKRYAEAEKRFREAFAAFPVAFEVNYHVGLSRFLAGDEAGARREFTRLLIREDEPLFQRLKRLRI